jgi:hypothetical protein
MRSLPGIRKMLNLNQDVGEEKEVAEKRLSLYVESLKAALPEDTAGPITSLLSMLQEAKATASPFLSQDDRRKFV